MAYKQYSDAFRSEAMIRLMVNKYDYELTAQQLGIAKKSLYNWEKDYTKKDIPDVPAMLERAIMRMLAHIPEKWNGNDWGIALGILLDKWLLVQGKANQRIENLIGVLGQLPDDELDELTRQFENAASRADTT